MSDDKVQPPGAPNFAGDRRRVGVTGEYYTIATDLGSGAYLRGETHEGHYQQIADAVEEAMRIILDRRVSCAVRRITTNETVEVGVCGQMSTETVTDEVPIPGPRSFGHDPWLSRYHPVNGWVLPTMIEIE
jgi:hypothetical protein